MQNICWCFNMINFLSIFKPKKYQNEKWNIKCSKNEKKKLCEVSNPKEIKVRVCGTGKEDGMFRADCRLNYEKHKTEWHY